ncbi:MAG: FAD-dependent oxidoreductase [Nitrospira sp.]|jgi:NADH dehydrogenase|nr:FAD-dependent oxidoreductase [Nitrospira sp.]MDI3464621.1 NADH dehydrogenase [Nitrospira sp.]
MSMTRIIIVGGGFAGVKCARTLRKTLPANTCEIVLFSRENNMVFYPLLAEVAGAAINPGAVTVPLRQMLPGVRCRTEEVRHVDVVTSEVEYERYDGRPGRVTFDHAVLACGTAVNLSLVPGMADHAFPLKSVGDAMALRFHVMEQLEKAEVCDDPERRRWYLSFVVVGGGFTGVEVVGEINDLIRASTRFYGSFTAGEVTVTLVHSCDQILPEVSPTLREFARTKMEQAGIRMMLNARAVSATAEGVELHDGRMLRGATVVCTIGATAPLLVDRLDVSKERGRLLIEPDMRVRGTSNLWAIGDCARIVNAYDGQVSPTTGQFAERQGRQAAENTIRALQGESTRPFFFRPLGQLCGIGEKKAVAEMFGVRLSGFPAWWLWRTVYLLKTPSWSRRVKVAFEWTWELLFPRDLAYPRIDRTERIARAHYRPGDFIFIEGEPAVNFYVIEQGEVEAIRRDLTGEPKLMARFGPGEFFGEIALLDGTVRIGSIRARTEVEVLVMSKEVFSQISGALVPFRNILAQSLRWRRPRLNLRLTQAWAVLEQRQLSEFMETAPEYHLSPDDTFENAVLLFDQHAVEFLYVLDNRGLLQGVITRNELFEAFAQGKKPSTKVRDFMRSDPIAVTSKDMSLMASDLMNKHDIDRLPVVESKDNRRLIGLVRSEKMLRWLMEQS